MASLQELGLKSEALDGTDIPFDQMPEFGAFTPPPQPAAYRFKLPQNLGTCYATVETKEHGTRVQVQFDQDAPLTIIQSPGGGLNGEPYQTRLSNAPRPRGKDKMLISDWDLLLRALSVGHPDVKVARPRTNAEYIKALMLFTGREFGADVEWSWSCNPQRAIWVDDGQGGTVEHPDKQVGCGKRYYQKDVASLKVDGVYPLRIACSGTRVNPVTSETEDCPAIIRAFANLTNFRK